MSEADLSEFEARLFAWIREHDFVAYPWSTPAAAQALGSTTDAVYEALPNLVRHLKGQFFLYYHEGSLHMESE